MSIQEIFREPSILLPIRVLMSDPSPPLPDSTAPVLPARVEPATVEDLPELTDLVMSLFEMEDDFEPNRVKQMHGLRLILEQPNRGRIFVVRTDHRIVGMVNILFTISTAEGGFVILMEDVIIKPEHRGHGFGGLLLQHVINFAHKRDFKRITLLTDKINERSQSFFHRFGFNHSTMVPMRWINDQSRAPNP